MKFIQRLSNTIFSLERILVIILMVIMLGSIISGVMYRYFLNHPLSWPEELAIYTLVWVTFIGGSMSIKRQQAAAVTLLVDKLNVKIRKILFIIGYILITIFCGYILYESVIWITAPTIFMQKSTSLGIVMFYPYLAIPIGFFCMTIHSLNFLVLSFSSQNKTSVKS